MKTLNFEQMEQVNGGMSYRQALCGGSLMASMISVGVAASCTGIGAIVGGAISLFAIGLHFGVC